MPLSDRASSPLPSLLPTQPAAIAVGKPKPGETETPLGPAQPSSNSLGLKSQVSGATQKKAKPQRIDAAIDSSSNLAASLNASSSSATFEGAAPPNATPSDNLEIDSRNFDSSKQDIHQQSGRAGQAGRAGQSGKAGSLDGTASAEGDDPPSGGNLTLAATETDSSGSNDSPGDTGLNDIGLNNTGLDDASETTDASETPDNNEALSTVLPQDNLASAKSEGSASFERSGALAQDAADLYQFSVETTGVFTAALTDLNADADVQLIQDKNGNGQADQGEIVAWEWEQGDLDESIRHFLQPGSYVLRVLDQDISPEPTRYSIATAFRATETDDRAFSINVVYKQGVDQLNAEAKQAVERAADYWENVISYSSFDRPLELALGLYGTTNRENPFLAYAGPRSYREAGDRLIPVVGVTVLNNLYLEQYNSNPDYLESVLRHEIGHVLGLGTIWDKQGNDLVDQDKAVYRADTYAGQSYGELLGTGVATEIPVDKDSLTHWDEDIFDAELITPRAEGIGEPLPLSQLTISSLRDLGWNVNYGAAEAFSLGGGGGSNLA